MGVFSRLNEQQKKQTEAENAMPGAYENRYDESIQNALADMNRQNTAGTGFDSSNTDYRGALSRLFGNAGAGADAAAQTDGIGEGLDIVALALGQHVLRFKLWRQAVQRLV